MSTTRYCCCGCTSRTGILILLLLQSILILSCLVFGIISGVFETVSFSIILICVVIAGFLTIIFVVGICGVVMKRPSFLLPYLVLQVFSMVMIIIGMASLAIYGLTLSILSRESAVIIIAEIMSLIVEGLTYYFFIVVLSFYKELKGELPR